MSEAQTDRPRQPQLRLGKLLVFIVPVALLLVGGAIAWGWFDVPARFQEWSLPPLVEVDGLVSMNGKPLEGAEITTRPVDNPRGIAKAYTDAEGRFKLMTDVRGDWKPGAYAGEHLVTISRPDPSVPTGAFKPPTITPPESEEFDTTPLRLTVERDPSRNKPRFDLTYTKPAGKGKMSFGKGKADGKGPPDFSKMKSGKGGFPGGKMGFGPGKSGGPPGVKTPPADAAKTPENSPPGSAAPPSDAKPAPDAKQLPSGEAKPASK